MADRKKKRKKSKRKARLPKRIIVIPNQDKTWHESWYKGRDELNFPAPWRAIMCGPPNSGKSLIVKNLIARADPPFEDIFLIHCDGGGTREYDDVDVQMLDDIPAPEEWEGEVKTLVVLDDLDYKSMNKVQIKNLSRLMGYVSTHKKVCVCICQQDSFQIPSIARRCANIFVMWKSHDIDSLANAARKTGLKSTSLKNIFSGLCHDPHDSLWIDLTSKTPMPMRLNGYTELKRSEDIKDAFEHM